MQPQELAGWRKKVSASAQSEEFVVDERDERLAPSQWLREATMLGIRDLDLGIDPAAWSASSVLRTRDDGYRRTAGAARGVDRLRARIGCGEERSIGWMR